jgi:hypothetical protein
MVDDGSPAQCDVPEMSGTFVLRKTLDELSRPILERFDDLLEGEERRIVLQAAARGRHVSPEAGCDWIRREACRRVFPRWASALGVSEDEARRGLAQVAARLHGLADGKPKRVFLAWAVLDRVAIRPADAFHAACQALGMTRNTVDQNKARALETMRSGTCFAPFPGWRLGELHLFFLHPAEPLLIAGRKLHAALAGAVGGLAAAIEEAHVEANRRRRHYEEKRRSALRLWKTRLPAALDAAGLRPLDVDQRFAAAVGTTRTHRSWQSLRLCDAIPSRILPATTWTSVLAKAHRPPTFILEGPWGALVRDLASGPTGGHPQTRSPREVLDDLLAAARAADEAHRAWKDAAERTYQVTRDRPHAVSKAIESFNLNLDGALGAPAKGVAR